MGFSCNSSLARQWKISGIKLAQSARSNPDCPQTVLPCISGTKRAQSALTLYQLINWAVLATFTILNDASKSASLSGATMGLHNLFQP